MTGWGRVGKVVERGMGERRRIQDAGGVALLNSNIEKHILSRGFGDMA